MEHPAFKISSVLLRDLYCRESQYYKEIETVVLKREEKKKSHLPSKIKKDFLKKMPSRESRKTGCNVDVTRTVF